MTKTKIIATLGPASTDKEVLREMLKSGVNVCRLNFSHGSHEDHLKAIKTIRELQDELGLPVSVLADLQGPKLRVGEVENNGVMLEDGATLTFTTKKVMGTKDMVYMSYPEFPADVMPGEKVLMDDGKLECSVVSTNGVDTVITTVTHGGKLSSKKGVNLPNTKVSLPCLTEKDLVDLDFALEQDVEWIGLSFVRNAADILELRSIIQDKRKSTRIIAKIEKPEALKDIDGIVKNTDALMIARGDLGVEIPMEKVPMVQKTLIKKARKNAKPVIVATQMMESMIDNITPTRAEVNDVANAVIDGADAVMLSGETSVGKYPVMVIKTFSRILKEIEKNDNIYHHESAPKDFVAERFISDSVCFNSCKLAQRVNAKALITMTHSGYTAFKLSSQRPKANIYAFTSNKKLLNTLSLVWGVQCFYYDKYVSTDQTISDIKFTLKKKALVKTGDHIINIASMPITEKGMANMQKLSVI